MFFLLLVIAGSVFAESAPDLSALPCSPPITSIEGRFSQSRHISVLAAPLTSSGEFEYDRGEGLTWHTTEPVDNEIHIVSGKGVVTSDAEGNSRPVPGSQMIAGIFLGVFSCDLQDIDDYFSISGQVDGEQWSLRLTPDDPGVADRIETILVRGDEHIERVDIRETNGDRRELTFEVTGLKRDGD